MRRRVLHPTLLCALLAVGACEASEAAGPPGACVDSDYHVVTYVQGTKRPAGATAALAAKYAIDVELSWVVDGGGFYAPMDRLTAHRIRQESAVAAVEMTCSSP